MKDEFVKQPLVSIVIPTYNRAEFLREAIASVLAQTYRDFELLILDNCSPDHTPEVVAGFKDARIKYLRHQCNIGSTANWTYGVYWAQGGFLSILGDDDKYEPDFVSSRMAAFDRFKEIDAVFSGFDACDETGKVLSATGARYPDSMILSGRELLKGVLNHEWFIGSTLFRTRQVVRYWPMIIRGGLAGDTALKSRMAIDPACRVAWIPGKGLLVRQHSGQESRSTELGEQVVRGCLVGCYELLLLSEADEYDDLLGAIAAWGLDLLGRRAWDEGRVRLARKLFFQQLRFGPFSGVVLLRLLRCYLPIL